MSNPNADQGSESSAHPKSKLKTSWKSLFSFTTKKHLPVLAIGSFFALVAGCVTPVLAVLLGNIFDAFTSFGAGHLTANKLQGKVIENCFGMIGLGGADLVLNGAYFMVFVAFGEFQASSTRARIFNELLKRDVEWFEAHQEGSGAFLSSVQAHINDLQMATSQPLGLLLQYGCRSIASLGLALYTSWRLSLVTLAGVPVFSAVIAYLTVWMKKSITAQQVELTEASKIANNTISSIDTVKCLNAETCEAENYGRRIDRSAFYYLKQARLNSTQIALIRWMMFGMFVQGFWYGSGLARDGKLSSGEVIRTFWACTTAAQSIEQVLPQVLVMEKGKFASAFLHALIRDRGRRRMISELRGTQYPSYCDGRVEVKNVSFAYPSQPEINVLNPSNFYFPPGETRFVIGKSGSGKSTLSQLLMRFYLPKSGQIFIDGYPAHNLDVHWIRNNITLLEQRSVLFNDSVLKNIAFGRRNYQSISIEEIREAVQVSMLESTILSLPKGLDTSVGPGGSFLSGGQRQRVAIARAKLRDTPILILDEPTSALDHVNRVGIMAAIREWRKGKTTIIITHDMSHIQPDDYLYILENGSILHEGRRHSVETRPGAAKYFPNVLRSRPPLPKKEKKVRALRRKASNLSIASSIRSTKKNRTPLPRRVRHARKTSYMQHHLPPGFRYHTYDIAKRKHKMRYDTRALNKKLPPLPQGPPAPLASPVLIPLTSPVIETPISPSNVFSRFHADEIEMVEIKRPKADSEVNLLKEPEPTIQRKATTNLPPSPIGPVEISSKKFKTDTTPETLTQILKTILPNLSIKERLLLFGGITSAVLHASATPIFSYCLSQLIMTFYVTKDSAHMSMVWSLAVLGVSTGDGITSFFMHYLLEYCGEAWMDTLRKKAFQRVLSQPRSFFEEKGNGSYKIASYLDQNGEDMRNLLGRFAGFFITAAAIMVIAVFWSLIVCWKLTLVALACGPIIYGITRGFEITNGRWEKRCNEANSLVSDIFTEVFSEIRTVRALTLQGYFHHKHFKASRNLLHLGLKRAAYTGAMFGLIETTVILSSALIFYYGAILVTSEFTVEDVVKVLSLLLFGIGYAAQILSWIPQINTSKEIATHLLRLARLSTDNSHEHRGKSRPWLLTPIHIMDLNFRYPSRPNTLVLKNVSFRIRQNSCTAIVGRSGSGKSTIAALILALYEAPGYKSGFPSITLGGHNILDLHVPTLRSQISIVSQQPTIFPGTIHTNISYGLKPHSQLASLENVRDAAMAAGIDEFIMSLPMGYSTIIGDGGVGLSGGQKQRIVIARALLRHPQILILDEATSSLDPAGAEIVRVTVQRLVATRDDLTVIIITHAKEMIKIADHIVVLDQGVVVEDGSYRDLSREANSRLRELIDSPEDGNA